MFGSTRRVVVTTITALLAGALIAAPAVTASAGNGHGDDRGRGGGHGKD